MNEVTQLLARFAGLDVWVIGDMMLDRYVSGAAERISPEAPVPVVRVATEEDRLGGAANVAHQVAALGARVELAGLVGADRAGAELLRLCAEARIGTRAVVELGDRRTTAKLRVLAQGQQLARLDWEDAQPCSDELVGRLTARFAGAARPHAVVLSDYAKGVCTPKLLEAVRGIAGAAPIVVDPKDRDFSRYRGATAATPNLRELMAAAGRALDPDDTAAIAAAAREVLAASGLESLVVTLGSRGMLLIPRDGEAARVAALRQEVFDVTGAGDTVAAVLALGLGAGGSLLEAAQLANAAAGVAVAHIGTVAVSAPSIVAALTARPEGKLLSRDELRQRASAWRAAGKRIVLTNGCFDLLHAGHIVLLRHAATLGDVLVLAVNSDDSVRRLKGEGRPLVSESDRAAILAAFGYVDAVTIFGEDTPLEVVRCVRPDVLVKGGDYRPAQVVGRELVESWGGRVEIVPLVPDRSTTNLVEHIRSARPLRAG